MSGPALFIHKGSSGTLGYLQRNLLIDAFKYAQVYLERFLEFHLYPPQTVTMLEGSLLNILDSCRQFQGIQTGTTLKGRLANLLHLIGNGDGIHHLTTQERCLGNHCEFLRQGHIRQGDTACKGRVTEFFQSLAQRQGIQLLTILEG